VRIVPVRIALADLPVAAVDEELRLVAPRDRASSLPRFGLRVVRRSRWPRPVDFNSPTSLVRNKRASTFFGTTFM
jgi:hypothetical protein